MLLCQGVQKIGLSSHKLISVLTCTIRLAYNTRPSQTGRQMDRQTDGQTEENMEMARRIVLTNASRALIIHKVHQTVGTIIVLLVDSGEAYYAN